MLQGVVLVDYISEASFSLWKFKLDLLLLILLTNL